MPTLFSERGLILHPQRRIVTSVILYHLPDFPGLLEEFILQQDDLVPDLPKLKEFLAFWEASIDGPIHSVTVAYPDIRKPQSFTFADELFRLH